MDVQYGICLSKCFLLEKCRYCFKTYKRHFTLTNRANCSLVRKYDEKNNHPKCERCCGAILPHPFRILFLRDGLTYEVFDLRCLAASVSKCTKPLMKISTHHTISFRVKTNYTNVCWSCFPCQFYIWSTTIFHNIAIYPIFVTML